MAETDSELFQCDPYSLMVGLCMNSICEEQPIYGPGLDDVDPGPDPCHASKPAKLNSEACS